MKYAVKVGNTITLVKCTLFSQRGIIRMSLFFMTQIDMIFKSIVQITTRRKSHTMIWPAQGIKLPYKKGNKLAIPKDFELGLQSFASRNVHTSIRDDVTGRRKSLIRSNGLAILSCMKIIHHQKSVSFFSLIRHSFCRTTYLPLIGITYYLCPKLRQAIQKNHF